MLDGGGLSRHQPRDPGISLSADHHGKAGQHGCHNGGIHALAISITTDKVTLTDMSYFMGDDGGDFIFAFGIDQQAGIQTDNTAGYGKGVDFPAVDHNDGEIRLMQIAVRGHFVNQMLDILLHQWIIEYRRLAPQLA